MYDRTRNPRCSIASVFPCIRSNIILLCKRVLDFYIDLIVLKTCISLSFMQYMCLNNSLLAYLDIIFY